MRDHVFLYINGRPVRVSGDDAFLTLAEFLRKRQALTGTKIVCAEGDCGACAVLVGRLNGSGSAAGLQYAPLNSCIQLMFQLDCTHVVTVEGLSPRDSLNPLQEAMVACHGTQCGYCTPGFVVSLYAMANAVPTPGPEDVRRALIGNLCRCTGYDSIVRAATTAAPVPPVDELYPPAGIAGGLSGTATDEVRVETGEKTFYKPATLSQAVTFRAANPAAVIVSGATDLAVLHNKQIRPLMSVLSIGSLRELKTVALEGNTLRIGATATLSDFERATIEHILELGRFMAYFGSPLIKNAGTLAGNLVTGSPIGDTLPALAVLNAQVELTGPAGARLVEVGNFYTGYRRTVMAADELLTSVRIPLLANNETLKLYKVSRRRDLDISTFSAAFWFRRNGSVIEDIRIVFGGVAPTILRMRNTETVLRGASFSADAFQQAADIAPEEVAPITDVRGSQDYRRALASNILMKLYHELDKPPGSDGNGHPIQPPAPAPAIRTPATLVRDKERWS